MNYKVEICNFEKKFIEIIRMKHYSVETEKSYLYHLRNFIKFKKPIHETRLSSQDINDYLVYLNTRNVSDSYFNQAINAIRFFFKYVLNKKIKDYLVVRPKKAKTNPIILDYDEIQSLFTNCTNKKHLAILSILYSAGLRGSEIINLEIKDIDSKQMIIHIRSAKGRKDRLVPLDETCLEYLREYYKEYKPVKWLFNGQYSTNIKPTKYTKRSIQEWLKKLAFESGINKRVYPHLIRHTKITHSLECGNDIHSEQIISGHSNIKTTIGYTHKSPKFISSVKTPLQNIFKYKELTSNKKLITI